jgi:hypothetical protein
MFYLVQNQIHRNQTTPNDGPMASVLSAKSPEKKKSTKRTAEFTLCAILSVVFNFQLSRKHAEALSLVHFMTGEICPDLKTGDMNKIKSLFYCAGFDLKTALGGEIPFRMISEELNILKEVLRKTTGEAKQDRVISSWLQCQTAIYGARHTVRSYLR